MCQYFAKHFNPLFNLIFTISSEVDINYFLSTAEKRSEARKFE